MTEALLARAMDGDMNAAARLITAIERTGGIDRELMDRVFRRTGRAEVIGITGTPGAGKSTLVAALIPVLRAHGRRVAVLAVDPSSPLTGGAVLGDRVRMTSVASDPDVFVRSMASRGELGGLALAVPAAIRLLDAVGMDVIVVETVGVGQSEVGVAAATDCVLVVVAPGGDAVQAMKAGVLEIADVIAVNKADLPDAERARSDLAGALRSRPNGRHVPKVLLTEAQSGGGVEALAEQLRRRLDEQRESGALTARRSEGLRREALDRAGWAVRRRLLDRADGWLSADLLDGLERRTLDPTSVGELIVERALVRP